MGPGGAWGGLAEYSCLYATQGIDMQVARMTSPAHGAWGGLGGPGRVQLSLRYTGDRYAGSANDQPCNGAWGGLGGLGLHSCLYATQGIDVQR